MKKVPLVFCLFFFACSSKKQIINNTLVFNKHAQPYHVNAIGSWNTDYVILTLTDAHNNYFIVKADYNGAIKKGDVYTPEVIN